MDRTTNVSRRGFVGAMGTAAAAAAAIPMVSVAQAEGVSPEQVTRKGEVNHELIAKNREELIEMVRDFPVATEDLVLPDGTVVDKRYVTLRAFINRLNRGIGNTPGAYSYDLWMHLFTPEEAEWYVELPILERFTAYDFSVHSGHSMEEATEILDHFEGRKLLNVANRGGVKWYYAYSWPGAMGNNTYPLINKQFIMDVDRMGGVDGDTGGAYPIYDVYPVSAEVVEGGTIAPHRDWRAWFEMNEVFTAQPCGCHSKAVLRGDEEEREEGLWHCLLFGEMAQYLIDSGIPAMTKEQAIAEAEKLIELGYVPQGAFAQNPDVMCFCHSDNCAVLTPYRVLKAGDPSFPNASAYTISYDAEKCIGCGICVDRCPMRAIVTGDNGQLQHEAWCVGCGQCALKCPADARILKLKDEGLVTEKPVDLQDQIVWSSIERMSSNRITDFVGTELPEYAIEISEANRTAKDASYNWLEDRKPTYGPQGCADGTYEVTRLGINGPMEFVVEIADDKIVDVTVVSHNEVQNFGTRAIDQVPGEIVAANSLDVDLVSGATHTSMAIILAVEDAMIMAGMPERA